MARPLDAVRADAPHITEVHEASATVASSAPFGKQPSLSIVVPTRNEAGNIRELVTRLEQALTHVPFEIVFVDDSDDDTVAAIEAVVEQTRCDIRVIHRPRGERSDGLGGAVVLGLVIARAPWVGVMDADLQHPPELVPRLLEQSKQTDVDLVVASRYCPHGDAAEFNYVRSSISHLSAAAARLTFPKRLHDTTDPLSGFFLVRKAAIDINQLRPQGFKILLEILIRTPKLRITEIGFHFGTRHSGHSKASFREGMRYAAHLYRLRINPDTVRFVKFLIVGLSGLFVNMLLLAFATEKIGLYYLWSAIVATQGSTLWNFGLTEYWVFSDRQQARGRVLRLVLFLIMNNAAFLLRGPMIYLLTAGLGVHYMLSNLISLIALTVVRYGVADNLIWGRVRHKQAQRPAYNYNIHSIITVQSDVWLPELERFLIQEAVERPTVRVRIGKVNTFVQRLDTTSHSGRRICYDEGLGVFGFGAEICINETIDVVASPLLRWSPHVLYTNIVEPILRWTFVGKGYALVHGACIAVGEHAYLVTARTDTGKTTTMLRILARYRRATDDVAFVSDDLTLVSRDGRVLTYPKPLTISHHTIRAINSALLSWHERVVLPFQSRIHSRSGRRFAFLLTRTNLPVATINTLVQLLVPPPKYHVQRLVPHAKVAHVARLSGMFVIERNADGDVPLDGQEAFEILMSNCEDAYGFPPYPAIKSFLHNAADGDLQLVERAIIADALTGRPTLLLRSTRMDWAQRISALINVPTTASEGRHADRMWAV